MTDHHYEWMVTDLWSRVEIEFPYSLLGKQQQKLLFIEPISNTLSTTLKNASMAKPHRVECPAAIRADLILEFELVNGPERPVKPVGPSGN